MSETIQTTENTKVEMTAEEYQQWERNVQLGVTDELPDGRKIKDVQKEYADEQLRQQENRRLSATLKKDETLDDAAQTKPKVAPETPLEVTIHANGVVSATPKVEEVEGEKPAVTNSDDDKEPDNDLPTDYPHRDKLIAAGHVSLEKVAKFTLDDLKNIDGIGPKSAEAILNYGKSV